MAIVHPGEWVEINTTRLNSKKIKLKGQKFQVLGTNPTTGELTVDTGEIMGQIELFSSEVNLTLPPKVPAPQKPSITPAEIQGKIQTLIHRYQAIGGQINANFLEQILGKKLSEQILSKPDISTKNSFCSEKNGGSICSENLDNSGAKTIEKLPRNKGGKPLGRKNTKAASGWLDKYESARTGKTTWYFCRDNYIRKPKKTRITSSQKSEVEKMIKLGYPAKQIEKFISDDIEF